MGRSLYISIQYILLDDVGLLPITCTNEHAEYESHIESKSYENVSRRSICHIIKQFGRTGKDLIQEKEIRWLINYDNPSISDGSISLSGVLCCFKPIFRHIMALRWVKRFGHC